MSLDNHYAEVANETIGYIKKQATSPYARALFATTHTTLLAIMAGKKLTESYQSAQETGQALNMAGRRFNHQAKDKLNHSRFKMHLAKRRIAGNGNGNGKTTKTTTTPKPKRTSGGGVELGGPTAS